MVFLVNAPYVLKEYMYSIIVGVVFYKRELGQVV